MHFEANLPPSAGFRHLKRTLNEGETVPRFPSLFEQLTACSRGAMVVATAEPAPEMAEEAEDDM
jgi:hypothetical protein